MTDEATTPTGAFKPDIAAKAATTPATAPPAPTPAPDAPDAPLVVVSRFRAPQDTGGIFLASGRTATADENGEIEFDNLTVAESTEIARAGFTAI